MKDKTIGLLEELEHQYRPYGVAEQFHHATDIVVKGKTTPVASWPEAWKKIYFKGYPRLGSIKLGRKFSPKMKTPFDKVLFGRTSTREFTNQTLTNEELSTLLFYAGGIKSIANNNWDLSRRFYPSGGARFPLEIYVVLYHNTELRKGVYHYNVKRHDLEVLKKGDYTTELQKGLDPPWLVDANIAILVTAVFGRNQTKYGDRGYRLILNEAGHMNQNIYLIASALHLGCCALGGYLDSAINTLLDIDGINESVVYATIIGHPKK